MLRTISPLFALLLVVLTGCGSEDTSTTASTSTGPGAGGSSSASSGSGAGAGAGGATGSGGSAGGDPGAQVIVAVGYGGRRMRSIDFGTTWTDLIEDDPDGGDDQNLLRDVTWAQGLFVAVGWRIHTSVDGVSWAEHTVNGQQWCGGVAYGNNLFVCVGGCGATLRSTNGIDWQPAANATMGCGHLRSLAFGNGVFVATGDGGIVTVSSDAMSWSTPVVEDVSGVVFRNGEFVANGNGVHKTSTDGVAWTQQTGQANTEAYGHGVYLRGVWKGVVERSMDGQTWETVFDDGGNHLQAFGFGFLPTF
jgi:hypothetical protein